MKTYKLRSYVKAPEGCLLLSMDLSQAESWIVAYLARDENMKSALRQGILHETTAWAAIGLPFGTKLSSEQRYIGKQTNHSTGYRVGPETAAESYNLNSPDGSVLSVAQARKNQNVWHGLYPMVKGSWWPEIDYKLSTQNRTLTNQYGFSYQWFGPIDNEMQRAATAFDPQSTVADHFNGDVQPGNEIPGGLCEFMEQKPDEFKVCNQSHDSFMGWGPKEMVMDMYHLAKKLFYRPIIINGEECWIPVDGEIGERWGELEKIKES